MDEYIRREDVIAWFMPYAHVGESIDADVVISDIKGMKAADVAPVTRCKDCKYLRVWNQKDLYAFCPKTNFVFLPFQADTRTHFCSYGEPKEGTC